MADLFIDGDFKNLIPPLSSEEFNQLEENILRDGIQDPLKIWNGILIDGHNRYKIAKQHNLNFATTELHFESRDDVAIWIIQNQFGRRNLTPSARIELALKLEPLIAAKAKENQAEYHGNQYDSGLTDKSPEVQKKLPTSKEKRQNTTNYKIAELAGVSDKTVQRYKKVRDEAPDEVKAALKSGNMSINEAYRRTKEKLRKDDIKKQVKEIEQKKFEKPDGLYDVIAIDPPWGYRKQAHHGAFDAGGRRVANPYPEMTQEELKEIELPAAENCVLFLWTKRRSF